jgi:hypothetical protein
MIAARNVVTRARVEGLVILAVALGYLWETRSIPSLYQMPGVPGPTAFPRLVGIVFAASGLWRMLVGGGRSEAPAGPPEQAAPGGAAGWLSRGGRFYAMWAVVLAYLVLMPELGFPVTTVVALAALFVLLGERRVAVAAGLSLAATAIMYLGFAKGLGVRLPLGILEQLVK